MAEYESDIIKRVDNLATNNVTVRVLQALDFVAPGEWGNITNFDEMARAATRETDPGLIKQVRARAAKLYNDEKTGYQRAMWLYATVDKTDAALATAALANQIGNKVGFLGFLNKITPKHTTLQYTDLAMKLTIEVIAFCQINGLPGDSIGDFVKSLTHYRHEALMRMGAIIALDGMATVGPDFVDRTMEAISRMGTDELKQNETFKQVEELVPGKSDKDKLGFIQTSFDSTQDWMKGLIKQTGMTTEKVHTQLEGVLDMTKDTAGYIGAFIDMTTDYMTHTGTQTIARQLCSRAIGEI